MSLNTVERWSSLKQYQPGAVVLHDGKFWVARVTTESTPGKDAGQWVEKAQATKQLVHDGIQAGGTDAASS